MNRNNLQSHNSNNLNQHKANSVENLQHNFYGDSANKVSQPIQQQQPHIQHSLTQPNIRYTHHNQNQMQPSRLQHRMQMQSGSESHHDQRQMQPSQLLHQLQMQMLMQSGSESPVLQSTLTHPHPLDLQNHELNPQTAMLQSHQRLHPMLPNGSSEATNVTAQAESDSSLANWYDAAYKKIQSMKEKYLPVLLSLYKNKKVRDLGHKQPGEESARKKEKNRLMVIHMINFLQISRSHITSIQPEKLQDHMRIVDDSCSKLLKNYNLSSKIPPRTNINTDSRFNPMQAQGSTDAPIGSRNSIFSLPNVQQYTSTLPHQTNDVAPIELQQTIWAPSENSLINAPQITGSTQSLPSGISSLSMATSNEKIHETVMPIMEQHSLHATEQQQPIDRLLNAAKSMSSEALIAACADMKSVDCMNDSPPSPPFCQSDDIKRRRIFDTESSTSTSDIKKPKIEGMCNLLQEIEDINTKLVETTVELDSDTDNDLDGTVVKISYNGISFAQVLKLHYNSPQMMPNPSIRLLVPTSYPNSSPMVLDALSDGSSENPEELTEKVKFKFGISLQILPELISLEEMARTWDGCARAAFFEFSKNIGGKSFSLRYGNWESCA